MKKKILKIGLGLVLVACVVLSIVAIMNQDKVTVVSDFLQQFGFWAVVLYVIIRVAFTVLFSFVPACSMMFDLLCVTTFSNYSPVAQFLICLCSVVLASITMDMIGRYGGTKAIIKLIGEEEYQESFNLIQEKGMVYIPFCYVMPIFPDDGICLVAGACKIKFWLHLIYIIFFRGVGVVSTVFGVGNLIPWAALDSWAGVWQNIINITVIAFWFVMALKFARWLDKKLSKKLAKKKDISD